MTPLQSMLTSIGSIVFSVWCVYLIGRHSVYRQNPGKSWMAQEAARMSAAGYVFWTTIGFIFTLFKRVFIKPITYLKTPRHSEGVGYVTPIEETWLCIQFVFWYLYALAVYPFIFVIHKSRLLYYRNIHSVYRDMTYSYDTRTGCSHWLPVNNGWVVKQSEWERDITIKPSSDFLIHAATNRVQFLIPYYYLEHFSLRKPVRKEQTIVIKTEIAYTRSVAWCEGL